MSTTQDASAVKYVAGHLRSGGDAPRGARDNSQVRTEQHRLPTSYEQFATLPEADPETIAAVTQTLSLYGHAVDNAAWELLGSMFAANATIDDGENVHDGPDALITALQARAERPAHHVVNTQVTSLGSDDVAAWSRLITIAGDGSVASADQMDVLTSTGDGWRVLARAVHPRHGGTARIEDGATPWAP
jgi:hypothetical protein